MLRSCFCTEACRGWRKHWVWGTACGSAISHGLLVTPGLLEDRLRSEKGWVLGSAKWKQRLVGNKPLTYWVHTNTTGLEESRKELKTPMEMDSRGPQKPMRPWAAGRLRAQLAVLEKPVGRSC